MHDDSDDSFFECEGLPITIWAVFILCSALVLIPGNFYGIYVVMLNCEFTMASCSILLFFCYGIIHCVVFLCYFINKFTSERSSILCLCAGYTMFALAFVSLALNLQIHGLFKHPDKLGEHWWLNMKCRY